jgi:hypothetical protein
MTVPCVIEWLLELEAPQAQPGRKEQVHLHLQDKILEQECAV